MQEGDAFEPAVEVPADLVRAIAEAARASFADLFTVHPGRYYYCSLVTTGEGHRPVVSAWSTGALSEATQGTVNTAAAAASTRRWSYADSPFVDFGAEHFAVVETLIDARPGIDDFDDDDGWDAELEVRLSAMEAAMRILDDEGLFGTGDDRDEVVVLAEVMPPDPTNTERAVRLNPRSGWRFQQWLAEAGE